MPIKIIKNNRFINERKLLDLSLLWNKYKQQELSLEQTQKLKIQTCKDKCRRYKKSYCNLKNKN